MLTNSNLSHSFPGQNFSYGNIAALSSPLFLFERIQKLFRVVIILLPHSISGFFIRFHFFDGLIAAVCCVFQFIGIDGNAQNGFTTTHNTTQNPIINKKIPRTDYYYSTQYKNRLLHSNPVEKRELNFIRSIWWKWNHLKIEWVKKEWSLFYQKS